MTDKTKLLELAERCEAATANEQGQLLLDAYLAAMPERTQENWARFNRFKKMLDAEAYESAAMTLVPEGWRVGQLEENWRSGRWHCCLTERPSAELIAAFDAGKVIGYDSKKAEAATPALALCAAALRARAAQ